MAKSYSIIFNGIAEDKRTFFYSLNSDSSKNVIMRVYETFMDYVEYECELQIAPNLQYWSQIPSNTKFRYVEFLDKDTNEIVGLFGLQGNISFYDYDYNGYIKGIVSGLSIEEKKDVHYILNEIFNQNIYNNDFICVEENDLVFDIGFNYGFFALHALRFKPSKIIGFEPSPKLVKKFNEVSIPNIELHEVAVSDKNGVATFYDNLRDGMSTLKTDVTQFHVESSFDVNTISFNDFIKNNNIQNIDYLKVDCEGSEYEIFESMDENFLTNNIKKIALEFHHELKDKRVLRLSDKIRKAGFEIKLDYADGGTTGMLYARKLKQNI